MGLYLYCVGRSDHPRPERVGGIEGAEVRAVEVEGLQAWVSPLERAPTASLDRVRRHNAVVQAANATRTPLPVRFGQWFGSEVELTDSLSRRREPLARGLERVRGAVELGVRIILQPRGTVEEPPDRTSGRAYLEALARREAEQEVVRRRGLELADAMSELLGPLVRERCVSAVGPGQLSIAHLVARHDTGTYRHRLSEFGGLYPSLRLVSSGPWPPYGFADVG